MDPADALQSAISNQGILLGEHDRALRFLREQQGSNNQRLNPVFELLQDIHERLSVSSPGVYPVSSPAQASASQGATPEPIFRDASFPTPDHFAGDVSKCGGFLLQCSLAFARSARPFSNDSAKISYIVALLEGRSLDWALAFFQRHSIDSLPYCFSGGA